VAVVALAAVSVWIHPHYLAYFNQLGGGPESGWRIVVDSNVDWGQDLKYLARYAKENDLDDLNSNLFGTAPLSAYEIPGETLPGWPALKDSEDALHYDWFYPDWPQPGTYVFSATQLQGLYLKSERSRFHWFRDREPEARLGYSLFVYEVAPTGPPVGLGLAQIPIRALDPSDYRAAWGSNNVQPRWFNAERSFLWPGGGAAQVWTAVGDGHAPFHPLLAQFYPDEPHLTGHRQLDEIDWGYKLYRWPKSPIDSLMKTAVVSQEFDWTPTSRLDAVAWEQERRSLNAVPVFDDSLTLLGYQLPETGTQPGQTLALLSLWRVERPLPDLKIFLHLLDREGNLVAQHDGLDVHTSSLRSGDVFAQLHLITIPNNLPVGHYGMQLGLYNPNSSTRLTVPVREGQTIDRILLPNVSLMLPEKTE
jgi:hypothetical protein